MDGICERARQMNVKLKLPCCVTQLVSLTLVPLEQRQLLLLLVPTQTCARPDYTMETDIDSCSIDDNDYFNQNEFCKQQKEVNIIVY